MILAMASRLTLAGVVLAAAALVACAGESPTQAALPTPAPAIVAADHTLPDLALTPGVARSDLTVAEICATKWGLDKRAVTAAMKREVFASYGFSGNDDPRCVADAHGQRCEIDHLISRELGGADDVKNLWPEPYGGPWNAHMKDRLENALHREVCAGTTSLEDARSAIAEDWTKAYRARFKDQ